MRKSMIMAIVIIWSGTCTLGADGSDVERKEHETPVVAVSPMNDNNTPTYQKCKNAVAILRGSDGSRTVSGTGFLCHMGGKKYLVTNCHVIDCNIPMQAFFQDGRIVRLPARAKVDIAENRDLARFDISTIKEMLDFRDDVYLTLTSAKDVPNIEDEIEFYGNSDGGGVVTVTAGKILAVGNDRIEIDAKIQSGNSGSPLVRVKDGKVVGVTTTSTFNKLEGDLSKVGTRYDPKVSLTREFAVRFTSVNWISFSYGTFVRDAGKRDEVRRFLKLLRKFCFELEFCLDVDNPCRDFSTTDIKNCLSKLAKVDGSLRQSRDKYTMMLENKGVLANKSGGKAGSYSRLDFEIQTKVLKDRTRKCFEMRLATLLSAKRILSELLWKSEDDYYRDGIDQMIREYREKYRLQLKGVNLPGIPDAPR